MLSITDELGIYNIADKLSHIEPDQVASRSTLASEPISQVARDRDLR